MSASTNIVPNKFRKPNEQRADLYGSHRTHIIVSVQIHPDRHVIENSWLVGCVSSTRFDCSNSRRRSSRAILFIWRRFVRNRICSFDLPSLIDFTFRLVQKRTTCIGMSTVNYVFHRRAAPASSCWLTKKNFAVISPFPFGSLAVCRCWLRQDMLRKRVWSRWRTISSISCVTQWRTLSYATV